MVFDEVIELVELFEQVSQLDGSGSQTRDVLEKELNFVL
jgi:hypothetical protein